MIKYDEDSDSYFDDGIVEDWEMFDQEANKEFDDHFNKIMADFLPQIKETGHIITKEEAECIINLRSEAAKAEFKKRMIDDVLKNIKPETR
jgi:hypothetical protein